MAQTWTTSLRHEYRPKENQRCNDYPKLEREVCTVQNRLGLADCLDLAGAGFLADIVILQQPIALPMKRPNVFTNACQLLGGLRFRIGVRLQSLLRISLRTLFITDRLLVVGTLVSGIRHHLLVLLLRILLVHLCDLHLLVQVLHQHVHHSDDTRAPFRLLGISTWAGWRRWGCCLCVCRDFYELTAS